MLVEAKDDLLEQGRLQLAEVPPKAVEKGTIWIPAAAAIREREHGPQELLDIIFAPPADDRVEEEGKLPDKALHRIQLPWPTDGSTGT